MRIRAVLLAILALTTIVAGLQAGVGTAATPTEDTRVLMTVDVQETGDAIWTVTVRYELRSANETAAFDALAADFEANRTDDGPQLETFRAFVSRAAERVNRTMAVTDVDRQSEIQNRSAATENGTAVGLLSLEFRWTNFATLENETIAVGNAFGPSWNIEEGQVLEIRPPEGYSVDTVRPSTAVENGIIRWEGPRTFGADHPSIRYVQSAPPENGTDWQLLLSYVLGVAVAILAGGIAVYAWIRRDSEGESEQGPAAEGGPDSGDQGPAIAGSQETESSATETAESETTDTDESASEGIDPELLSDEERVEHILSKNDGRMKQAAIVEETGWSNAKVSQLLSAMAEDDRIEKLRIGRENLISLPDEE